MIIFQKCVKFDFSVGRLSLDRFYTLVQSPYDKDNKYGGDIVGLASCRSGFKKVQVRGPCNQCRLVICNYELS
jgi:hypothetical protein